MPAPGEPRGELRREIGALDGALLTIGSVVGTGIFLTASDVARALPHAGLVLLAWLAGGLLTLAGALTYGELGAMFPRAGGLYHFLKEAYGPLWGFLYGWTAFLVIMAGGIAAIAVGFARYAAVFAPGLQGWRLGAGAGGPGIDGIQLVAVAAIALLTAVHHVGLKPGLFLGNGLTVLKVLSVAGLIAAGLLAAGASRIDVLAPLPAGLGGAPFLAACGTAMVAALWTYDGWYGLTFSAGEMRRPTRDLPLGLALGCAAVTGLYLLLNLVYLRALPLAELAGSSRVAEDAAAALLGSTAARLTALAVLVSSLGCLAVTILYSSRIYLPMAQDGVFFRAVAGVHERWRTPVASLWAQSSWAVVLVLTGSYEQLYTYVVFASVLFQTAIGAAVFVLRRRRPDQPRPYRAWGYPLVPGLFITACAVLVVSTLLGSTRESLAGLGLVALGLPAYAWWRRPARRGSSPGP